MKRLVAALFAALLGVAAPASAHVAFSSVDVRITEAAADVTIVAQAYDIAHELGIAAPEQLLDLAFLVQQRDRIAKLFESELDISTGGEKLTPREWAPPSAAPDQQLVRMRAHYDLAAAPGRITIAARLFAYDSAHQTLANVYEGSELETQQMLDAGRVQFEYFTKSRAGLTALVSRFARAGLERSLRGSDQLLFVTALVLVGGTRRRLGLIAIAFTVSCGLGLWLGTSSLAIPVTLAAPGVALSVVYAGVDNLMVSGRRDVREWIALGFGWVHGLDFAHALGTLDRPVRAFAWAVASFGAGLEAGLLVAALAAVAVLALTAMNAKPRLVQAASVLIAAIGVASFVHRVMWR